MTRRPRSLLTDIYSDGTIWISGTTVGPLSLRHISRDLANRYTGIGVGGLTVKALWVVDDPPKRVKRYYGTLKCLGIYHTKGSYKDHRSCLVDYENMQNQPLKSPV